MTKTGAPGDCMLKTTVDVKKTANACPPIATEFATAHT